MTDRDFYISLTKQLGLKVIKLVSSFPSNTATKIIMNQIIRCSTSVGSNYRAVCRARSKADFIAKMGIVEEEADETLYWIEVLNDTGIASKEQTKEIFKIANRIVAFTVASLKTAKQQPKERNVFINRQPAIGNRQ